MVCQDEPLVSQILDLYDKISALHTLSPSHDVNTLFNQLVSLCVPPSPIDVSTLCNHVQDVRAHLIKLCGEAEGLLEKHYSCLLGSYPNPLNHLDVFPYFNNYLKLGLLEYSLLMKHCHGRVPRKVAFVGSGPLPLTSIVLAMRHLTASHFHNYDIDPNANEMAEKLVEADPDLSKRMHFRTADIMEVGAELAVHDVVFLAALVGMDREEKQRVVHHLASHMAPGAILMVRSAHGARAFLYPVVDPTEDLCGFETLTVYHPTDEVVNSVVIARKLPNVERDHHLHHHHLPARMMPSCKCAEIQSFNPLNHGNLIEELGGHQ